MGYTINFVHSTMFGLSFVDDMNEMVSQNTEVESISITPPIPSADDIWDDLDVTINLKATESIDALITGLLIMKQLMTLYGIEVFSICGENYCYFTEENL